MLDLNSLRLFDRVATHRNFTAAARSLGLPKSTVSRAVTHLEAFLGTRLLQRSTREVVLTESGAELKARCQDLLAQLDDALDHVGCLGSAMRGVLKVSTTAGFGTSVLSMALPTFFDLYPDVKVTLDLTSQSIDLVAANVDVAIRMGPLSDSQLIATRLGSLPCGLYCAGNYAERKGAPSSVEELAGHQIVELPANTGRLRVWTLTRDGVDVVRQEVCARTTVGDVGAIHRLVINGAGVARLPLYLAEPDVEAGRLVRLLPEWKLDSIDVSAIFPSHRELSPIVRAFVDFLKTSPHLLRLWDDWPSTMPAIS